MIFPSSFFEDEVREGFYVSGIIKRAWAAQLEVLEDIAKVCEKHQIRWFADCGTLLGAVRHGGYVPWDDDLDICMLRDDLNRFKKIAREELPEGYLILDNYMSDNWGELVTRVTNGQNISLNAKHLEKFHDFPFVAGVDIFPLDYLSPNPEEEELRKGLANVVKDVAYSINEQNEHLEEMQVAVAKIEELCGVTFDRAKSLKRQLLQLLDQLFSLYSAEEATEVALMWYWVEHDNHVYQKKFFDKAIRVPFEETKIRVPAAYDSVLQVEYGNYMKESKRGGEHNYPFFMDQEEILMDTLEAYPFRYTFSKADLQREKVEKKERGCKEVVFLPYKASTWDAMESVWKAANDDPNCDAYVIPIPYFERNAMGHLQKMHYEADLFPDYVPIVNVNDYDFENRKPDVIIIQNPYDACNYTTSVHPFFYSNNLQRFTPKLVYIPYFVTSEIDPEDDKAIASMRYYVTVPGVVRADKVIVQSERMRQSYIDVLTEFAGEDTRTIWEEKILGLGSPKLDAKKDVEKCDLEMPEEWKRVIFKADGSAKKVILYGTSVSALVQYGEKMLDKMRNVFGIFKENQEEVVLLWRPHPLIRTTLESDQPQLWEEYEKIVQWYHGEGWGIYDDTNDVDRAVMLCDGYYGDGSSVVQLCKGAGKPILLQDVLI